MSNQEKFQLYTYKVGEKYPELQKKRDGGYVKYEPENGWFLYLTYSNLNKNEISNIQDGSFTMTFESIQGVAFFCFKFGNMSLDVPFYISKQENKDNFLKEIADNQGYMLSVIIVENTTGEIKGIRAIGIGNGISKEIRRYCLASMESDIPLQQYHNVVNNVYAKYNTEQLMRRATCYWKLRL